MTADNLPAARPHEDEPVRLEPGLPPEIASPLAPFAGAQPDRPKWFSDALASEPERRFVPVKGADIELLTWGKVGNPGLILVHGNSAHADWWSFIAPFFADTYRVAAISLSGMGESDWRPTYSFDLYGEEIHECAIAAGLYDAPVLPIFIGHSFGGALVFHTATRHPEWMRAALLVDTGFGGPPTKEEIERMEAEDRAAGRPVRKWNGPPQRGGANRVYPTLEAALTRFRFMPPQVPGNLYIADYIARRSLKRAPMADGSGEGWTWRFDPELWAKLDRAGMTPTSGEGGAPMAHIYGDRSAIITRHKEMGRGLDMIPASAPRVALPDIEHHVMVDQLGAAIITWP